MEQLSITKEFDQDLYDEFNDSAKSVVSYHLQTKGYLVNFIGEDYREDIKTLLPIRHEVEVKRVWDGEWNTYWSDIHIPYRKKKLLNGIGEIYFWILRNDLSEAWVVNGKHLRDSFKKEVRNREISRGELFYCIPLALCKKVKIKNGVVRK